MQNTDTSASMLCKSSVVMQIPTFKKILTINHYWRSYHIVTTHSTIIYNPFTYISK